MHSRCAATVLTFALAFLALPLVASAEDDGISPADHRLRRFQKKEPRTIADAVTQVRSIQQSNRDRRGDHPAAAAEHPQSAAEHPASAGEHPAGGAPRGTRTRTHVERSGSESTVAKLTAKLGRGIVNILTGWVEFPVQIVKRTKEDSA